jgi:hypothetical protein
MWGQTVKNVIHEVNIMFGVYNVQSEVTAGFQT